VVNALETAKKKRSFAIGYSLVLHSFLMMWIQAGMTTAGVNVMMPHFVETLNVERIVLLNLITVASLCAVVASILFAELVKRFGPGKITVFSLLIAGCIIIGFSHVSSLGAFIATICIIFCLAQGWANVTTNTLIANWYTKKKAIVYGITTMGLPAADILLVPLLKNAVSAFGFTVAYTGLGCFFLALGVLSIFWVKDNPEELGLAPDNAKLTQRQMQNAIENLRNFKSQWTFKRLIRDPNAWLLAVGFGLVFMCNKGMITQLSYYFVDKGYTYDQGILFMSRFALLGLVGSYFWGWVDDRIGTKKASILYFIQYGVGYVLMSLDQGPLMWIGFILMEFGQGGIGTLIPSMQVTCYGRYEFPAVNRLLNPMIAFIYAFATATIGFATSVMGGTGRAPLVLGIIIFIGMVLVLFIKPHPRDDLNYDNQEAPPATERA
jgi:OFA family oxalate/formate antiporter-like MFS transporter